MFPTQEDRPMFEFTHTYAALNAYLENNLQDEETIFDLYIRDLPPHRNYLVFAGLEEVLKEVVKMKFSDRAIKYLKSLKVLGNKGAKFLKKWKFKGDIYAMDEGDIFFGYEPVIKVKANIVDAQLINLNLINTVVSNTLFSSKFARIFTVCDKYKKDFGTGTFRAHSFESGFKARRASILTASYGSPTTPSTEFMLKDKPMVPVTIAQHSFIMSAENEEQAMRIFMENATVKEKWSSMVDTYDYKKGMKKFVKVLNELGIKKTNTIIDSGDIAKQARYHRKILDKNGLRTSTITAASNLDEYKIEKLCKKKAPVDLFITITEAITSSDSPVLDFVYKVAQINKKNGSIAYCGKLSEGKLSFPGDKEVMRKIKKGKFVDDVLCLDKNKKKYLAKGYKPLLKCYVKNGKYVRNIPDVYGARKVFLKQIKQVPDYLKKLGKSKPYRVKFAPQLYHLLKKVKEKHI